MTVQKYSDLEREQEFYYGGLRAEQRAAYTADLLERLLPHRPLWGESYYETLPVPWYGRLRQWLHGHMVDFVDTLNGWAGRLDTLAWHVDYRARPKNPPSLIKTGSTISFRKYAPLTTITKEVPTDDPQ